jgi:hypothetical protein
MTFAGNAHTRTHMGEKPLVVSGISGCPESTVEYFRAVCLSLACVRRSAHACRAFPVTVPVTASRKWLARLARRLPSEQPAAGD